MPIQNGSRGRFLTLALRVAIPLLAVAASFVVGDADAQARNGADDVAIATLSVGSGAFARTDALVSTPVAGIAAYSASGSLSLVEITNGANTDVPLSVGGESAEVLRWILKGDTPAGAMRTYVLRHRRARSTADDQTRGSSSERTEDAPRDPTNPSDATNPRVRVEDDGANLHLSVAGRPVLSYRHTLQPSPDGVDPIYGRSGFIHPVQTPAGVVLSRIQPPDHYHHYGIWNPWTHTEYNGKEVDFWNLVKGQGTVRSSGISQRRNGAVVGGFSAQLDHIVFDSLESGTVRETVVLNETWGVDAWSPTPDEPRVFIIDFASTLSPSTALPLTIAAYRYQGFSLRAAAAWNDESSHLLSSGGFDKSNANGTRARWLDVAGASSAQAGSSGILFLSHPSNHNHPEQLRVWPTGMNDGSENVFVNFNPAQEQDWVLRPGNTYEMRYRMVTYDGEMTVERAEAFWKDYAYPPTVTVVQHDPTGKRILVYTRNGEGYVHENIPYAVEAIRKLGREAGFEVEVSDDPALFTDATLARFDALVFSNANNDAFDNAEQRTALQRYVRGGGGFVGIHSASGSERSWPWFSQLLGGNFERHAPRQDFVVDVIDRTHPATAFLPQRWAIEDDECYFLKELNPRIRPLLAADLTTVDDPDRASYPDMIFGDSFPLAWYQEFDGGRQFYTSLGHRPEHYSDPVFMRHILGGISWVTGE